MNETVSISIDSKYHRARCPVCAVTCQQRRRSVRVSNIDVRQALECVECESIYVVDNALVGDLALPDGWSVDRSAAHMPAAYVHSTGARVQCVRPNCWSWYGETATYGAQCRSPMTCMLDAMTAALALTSSAAELHARLEREYGCINCRIDRGSRQCAESGHRDCDAGKVAAELARGEP